MSVDSKIKSLLERVNAKASVNEAEQMGASSSKKDSTISPKNPGDSVQPKQGDSENASFVPDTQGIGTVPLIASIVGTVLILIIVVPFIVFVLFP